MFRDVISMDQEKDNAAPWPWSLKDLPAALTASAFVAGVVVYGLLATAYDEFYAELGLTPADVGISYGQALGGAAALSVLVVLLMAVITYVFWRAVGCIGGWTRRRAWVVVAMVAAAGSVVVAQLAGTVAGFVFLAASVPLFLSGHPRVKHEAGRAAVAGVSGAGLTFLVLSVAIALYANSVADHIKGGGWVEPPAAGGMVFFSVRAMPVTVISESITGPDHELAKGINDGRSLFLGQANGLLVIYNADTQESLLLPVAKFRVQVLNCETNRSEANPRCQ